MPETALESVEMMSKFPEKKVDPVRLLVDFFNQLHVIERFNVFKFENITGWENWFQIELAYFLYHHVTEQDGEWWREFSIKWDGMPENIERCKPDFWLWSGEKNSYYLLELKQNGDVHTALKDVIKDIKKLSTLTNTKTFNAVGYDGKYTCKGKFFVLVSKYQPNIVELPAGAAEVFRGALARVVFTLLYIVLEDYSGILISRNHLD
ncbi:protein of unknown function [Xenorhabdus poinarii G6]|uniref:Uncharacterized protein n=1 Tax=Xenorhabdus poinarii G6 TaxID=1354304 RepID=A0A068R0Q2_9GAMM|nr:hypothetical protein [Xenorhabdus poinarii]CDG19670.1 protein of unknown function [Xenorhabdus poinarii G6]